MSGGPPVAAPPRRGRRRWALGALVVLVAIGVASHRPSRTTGSDTDTASIDTRVAGRAGAGSHTTTSRRPLLELRRYNIGDCVSWDQDADPGPAPEATRVAACTSAHLLEITGAVDLGIAARYPSDEAWHETFRTGECKALAERYLGRPHDPNGRFFLTGIRPTLAAWERGYHRAWCGLAAVRPFGTSNDGRYVPAVGSARGQDQTRVRPVGTCLPRDPAARKILPAVPCSELHHYEVTGAVDVGDRGTSRPESDEEWAKLVGGDCRRLAEGYLGQPLGRDVSATWFPIGEESWAAGRRVAECGIARYGPDGTPLAVSGSLRDQ